MEWPCPSVSLSGRRAVRASIRLSVRTSTIACERDILKTAYLIDLIF